MAWRCVLGCFVLLASAEVVRSAGRIRAVAQTSDSRYRPLCSPSTGCVDRGRMSKNRYLYEVNGTQFIVEFMDGHYFTLRCNNNKKYASLLPDNSEMPAFSQPVTVKKVNFNRCMIPEGSYYSALKAFNVTVTETLMLQELPTKPQLNVQHMDGLQIINLKINAADSSTPPQPSSNFLDKLSRLRMLELTEVVPEPEALNRLPTTLEILRIVNGRLPISEQLRKQNIGKSWIERLNSLRLLYLVESPASADGGKFILPELASLNNLTSLSLYNIPLDEKGLSTWLKGSSVKQLILNSCGLTWLPSDMFAGTHLDKVILAHNALNTLENGLFTPLQGSLTDLDLSNNNLRELTSAVYHLQELKYLKANGNPLQSLCGNPKPVKPQSLANLPAKLQRLELKYTNATRICSDWISDGNLDLMYIDLTGNQIEEIEYSDLEMMRTTRKKVQLKLMKNNLLKIKVTHENYNTCLKDQSRPPMAGEFVKKRVPVELSIDALPCNCNAYWFREVLRDCSLLTLEHDVKCNNNNNEDNMAAHEMLQQYGPDEISCPFSGYCMPNCSCHKRLRDNATVMRCTDALSQPPRWPETALNFPLALYVTPRILDYVPRLNLVELHAPDNNITNIDEDDIPKTLRKLNVSNNLIAQVSVEAARALSNYNTQVSLAGNRLVCDCADVAAFSHLKHVVLDWNSTMCADLISVAEKTESEMCYSPMLPIFFGVAVPLLFLVVAVLAIQRFLTHIKQFLFNHNLCHKWILKVDDTIDDPRKTHDVFLSYSYLDLELLLELKSGLEKLGYSTIEHENDWGPGESVLNQIATSVLKCRRTLLLVTNNYASSEWTKVEFDSAHTHALECRSARVLIVRHNLTNLDALPKDLRLYIQQNTYLDWKDDKFWIKLCRAMPPLRQDPELTLKDLEEEKDEPLLQITYPHIRR